MARQKTKTKSKYITLKADYVISRHPTFLEYLKDEDFKEKLRNKGFELDLSKAILKDTLSESEAEDKIVVSSALPIYLLKKVKVAVQPVIIFPRDPEERAKIIKELEKDKEKYKNLIKDIEVFALIDLGDERKRKKFKRILDL